MNLSKIFISKPQKTHISISPVSEKEFSDWLKKQKSAVEAQVSEQGFKPKGAKICVVRNAKGFF